MAVNQSSAAAGKYKYYVSFKDKNFTKVENFMSASENLLKMLF